MPINYKDYPPNWKSEIRPRILERANYKCEECGIPHLAVGYRDDNGTFHPIEGNEHYANAGAGKLPYKDAKKVADLVHDYQGYKYIVIVVTIAHLDHDVDNWEVKDERLKALCQKCHTTYDGRAKRKKNLIQKYIRSLFPILE